MSFIRSSAVVLGSLGWLSVSIAWADQVVLKNGDKLPPSVLAALKADAVKTTESGMVTTPVKEGDGKPQ